MLVISASCGEPAHAVLQVEAVRAESGEVCRDLLGDGFRRPDVERSVAARSRAKDSLVGIANPRVLLTRRMTSR